MSNLSTPAADAQDKTELDSEELQFLLSFCHSRSYRPKTTIIRPGDPANTLYYLIEGSVTVSLEDQEGRELILAYVNAGQYLGETPAPRTLRSTRFDPTHQIAHRLGPTPMVSQRQAPAPCALASNPRRHTTGSCREV